MGKSKGQQRKETQTEGGPQCQIGLRNQDKVEKRPVDLASDISVLAALLEKHNSFYATHGEKYVLLHCLVHDALVYRNKCFMS